MISRYNPMLLVNILSMKNVRKIPSMRITMDTLEESAIRIHLSDENVLKFQECYDGLYY